MKEPTETRDVHGAVVPADETGCAEAERHLGYASESCAQLEEGSPEKRAIGHLWYAIRALLRAVASEAIAERDHKAEPWTTPMVLRADERPQPSPSSAAQALPPPRKPPPLFIYEEEEIGGGYHTLSTTAEVERGWSEPYRKSGVAQYRNRVVRVPYPPARSPEDDRNEPTAKPCPECGRVAATQSEHIDCKTCNGISPRPAATYEELLEAARYILQSFRGSHIPDAVLSLDGAVRRFEAAATPPAQTRPSSDPKDSP